MKSQLVPEQVAIAFGGVLQGAQLPPHERVPGLQFEVHVPEEQLLVALGKVVQGEQRAPQESTEVSLRHSLPQRWKPETQTKSQVAPSQAATAFAGVAHGAQLPPHASVPL